MKLSVPLDTEPMEAKLTADLPTGDDWIYEPKWDGFRCLAFRSGDEVELRSKGGKPLTRYFPDVVDILLSVDTDSFVLDGEIVIPIRGTLSFDDLLQRIHPAASRVTKLAKETPALFIVFDMLMAEDGTDLTDKPLRDRRNALESFAARYFAADGRLRLSPSTADLPTARKWLAADRLGLDGVMAKRAEMTYQSGNRTGMAKVKRMRTAECVVGGFRWGRRGGLGSMLLGLHDDDGLLHHVGFCSAFSRERRGEIEEKLVPLKGGAGFSGRAPGGPSRWRTEGEGEWEAVDPVVVVEVQYDHFSGDRFRHGTKFLRWRPDKNPEACTLAQVISEGTSALKMF